MHRPALRVSKDTLGREESEEMREESEEESEEVRGGDEGGE